MSGLFVKGSHVEHALRHYKKYKDENYGSIKIGNDVWIGMDVIIRGNANIGDGAVVAARSFVRESVPPYAVVGGSPAKLLKWRFDKKTRDSLCRIKWWNWSDEKIAEHIDEFYDPKAFVRRYDRR
ncbi:MAG: hypothetical protein KGH57_00085 [Candidatus Micrarchaeota archaeon]|nr:hypothetical protein [Candidatus Micrarchaeota archaeon]